MPEYKFNEGQIIKELKQYIDNTYDSHYANGVKRQATEIIIDQGHGTGFCMGNILKYAQRYGKKEGKNKRDLLKVIHYAIIQLSQDHYKNDKTLLDTLQEDLLQYDIGKFTNTKSGEEPPLRSVMSEKLNNPND